jgi:polyisoprenoid-binding protein YceI
MKRMILTAFAAVLAFAVLSQTGAEAVNTTHADRFSEATMKGESAVYNLDGSHSAIGFRIKHMGLVYIPGYFRDFTGKINFNAEDISKSSVEFTAKVTSIDTGVARRDDHLRSKDFFEVETYPEITFKSTKVDKMGDNWMLTGDFTMKGVKKSITFPFNITGWVAADARQGTRMGATAETTINRKDYGITYGTNLPTGVPVIGDEVKINIQLEALAPKKEVAEAAQPN